MVEEVTLRPATDGDAREIALLHAESWRLTYRGIYLDAFLDGPGMENRLDEWQERLEAPGAAQQVIVAERDGSIVGFICMFGAEDARWGSLIDNLHVAPGLKRSGIGKQLMRAGARWLVDQFPGAGVYLYVLQANENARRYYEAIGARDEGATEEPNVSGGTAFVCRYAWESPQALLAACSA
jgi:ribosomal protein S18 acetylase RimI-like enzyme